MAKRVKVDVAITCEKDKSKYLNIFYIPWLPTDGKTVPKSGLFVVAFSNVPVPKRRIFESAESAMDYASHLMQKKWRKILLSSPFGIVCDYPEINFQLNTDWCVRGNILHLLQTLEKHTFEAKPKQ